MSNPTRRRFLATATASAALIPAAKAWAVEIEDPSLTHDETLAPVRRNISSFSAQDWRDHFDSLGVASIVADTTSRALHYWDATGEDYRIYPTSVPMSDELTKRGYTKIVRKKVGPDWTPTPNMLERDPDLKYMPPGPGNPLGTHAMYLDWPAYLIHGTHDTRKIGRRSSSGCIGLYNHFIAELFEITPVGTQVRVI
ncbi:L,D-transpeptidase family protein [Sulfitobacter sp. BDSS02]|uniref:L,D-transpeptidase n=1 Tax=Heliomarina sp. TaxID=2917556 RepID=UPI0040596AE6|nr:L,D-transpeptidase family protein [Sulfitobacter sp. BDSS02]MBR9850098.1 L,D-transpeptidase [Paracoccaceae bacterium]